MEFFLNIFIIKLVRVTNYSNMCEPFVNSKHYILYSDEGLPEVKQENMLLNNFETYTH